MCYTTLYEPAAESRCFENSKMPSPNQLEEIAVVFAVIDVDGDMVATDCRSAKAALRCMGFSIRKKDMVQVYGHTTTLCCK